MGKKLIKKITTPKEDCSTSVRFNLHKGLRERQCEAWKDLNEALSKLVSKQEMKEAG